MKGRRNSILAQFQQTKTRKRARIAKKKRTSPMTSLPYELTTEVLARVASFSATDFLNLKLSCKCLYNLSEDDYIYQKMSLGHIPVIPWAWSIEKVSFLKRCMHCGNPEALFRQGVVDYFCNTKTEDGLNYLKRAAESGHAEASYILGMLLIYMGEESEKQQGMDILKKMIFLKMAGNCRKQIKVVRKAIWLTNKLDPNKKPTICRRHQLVTKGQGWCAIDSEDAEDLACKDCMYDREIFIFCNILCH